MKGGRQGEGGGVLSSLPESKTQGLICINSLFYITLYFTQEDYIVKVFICLYIYSI